MTPDVAEEEIARLKKLAEGATSPPWHVDKYDCYIWGPNAEMVADRGCVDLPPDAVVRMRGVGGGLPIAANMALIVAARNALPQLLAAIESLSRQIAEARAERDTAASGYDELVRQREVYRDRWLACDAEVTRLSALVGEIKAIVCGDRAPNWDYGINTTKSRLQIADLADTALSPAPQEPPKP